MFIGMLVLGGALSALLGVVAVDVSDWRTDAPALLLLYMAFTMTSTRATFEPGGLGCPR